MKIVIAGAGEVGCHLAKMLSEGYHEITIIDNDEERLALVSESMDVLTVQGNPTSITVLKSAGVDKADLFVAVSPAKEQDVNLVSAIIAKKLGAKKVTARINDAEYLNYDNKVMFTDMGIDLLFYPEKIAATEIGDLLKQSDVSEFVDFARGQLQLVVFRIEEGSRMLNKSTADFPYEQNALPFKVVAIARSGETLIPQRDTLFKRGDMVYVVTRREYIGELMSWSGKQYLEIKRLTILGGGRIGEMVARQFEKTAEFVKIIEINRDRCEVLSENLDRTLVINGDGRNSDFLYEEDVKSCDAFVAVTSSSETNILACVAAKKMGVAKTIAEVENIEYIKLAEGMGVDAVINKKIITAGRIFRFTMSTKVRTVKVIGGSDAEVIEYIVNPDSQITKAPIKDLHLPSDTIIGGVIRGNETIIATEDTWIKPYDRVVIFALPTALGRIEKFFA
ncbi:MAG: Trk system potassium transporter TrkA [Bacteroidales bacterium]|jgi:trk system potassium uptake protein TrkA|nr:Trk system potassium transporter TrkA [Bacteroidales bacterium]